MTDLNAFTHIFLSEKNTVWHCLVEIDDNGYNYLICKRMNNKSILSATIYTAYQSTSYQSGYGYKTMFIVRNSRKRMIDKFSASGLLGAKVLMDMTREMEKNK